MLVLRVPGPHSDNHRLSCSRSDGTFVYVAPWAQVPFMWKIFLTWRSNVTPNLEVTFTSPKWTTAVFFKWGSDGMLSWAPSCSGYPPLDYTSQEGPSPLIWACNTGFMSHCCSTIRENSCPWGFFSWVAFQAGPSISHNLDKIKFLISMLWDLTHINSIFMILSLVLNYVNLSGPSWVT